MSRGEPQAQSGIKLFDLLKRGTINYIDLVAAYPSLPVVPAEVSRQAEITARYEGYIAKQHEQIRRQRSMEETSLPAEMDYMNISGLRIEAREKLNLVKPANLGQAGRISGVSPADIAVLMVYMGKSSWVVHLPDMLLQRMHRSQRQLVESLLQLISRIFMVQV